MVIQIRKMVKTDIEDFFEEFATQGWDKSRILFEHYFEEQESNKRQIFVATLDGKVAGYATLLQNDVNGAFKNRNIPTICDFNVLIKYQKQGVGAALLDEIENKVKEYSNIICLGVGLHGGYGSAQRMYVKRGYIPDGSGVWYKDDILSPYASCNNDDDLILYFSKQLKAQS